ncbi:TonB-dependent receptor [Allomuricauda sp. d1]|uniref:TonB-dependent receptor n=1 Tax=Allomuricauda sp. d1 TaxID=3136725 RepID=UPI0031D57102
MKFYRGDLNCQVAKTHHKKPVILYWGCLLLIVISFTNSFGQTEEVFHTDSILTVHLQEVILIKSRMPEDYQKQAKPLAFIDDYLEKSHKVCMVKRGAYAWEPMVNSMTSERLSITIDGMRIFPACTDKMDPITSYVDVSNLQHAKITSGQEGAEIGSAIGGGIDLQLDKSGFENKGWQTSFESGFEANNMQRILGSEINYSDKMSYVDADIIYRKADNYAAGGGEEVAFSQFEKYNLSANGGIKINKNESVSASFIYDEARNVGYPALPMDVSLARGIIGSAEYQNQRLLGLDDFTSKIYFNTITHIMDDSQRPDVPIRMDMPGWSDTYGFINKANLKTDKHSLLLKWDGFYNRSLAEMTMYPNNSNEPPMFMLTWPDVHTLNTGIYLEDELQLNDGQLKLSGRLAFQDNRVADEFGLNSLRIFYPNMEASQTRLLKSISVRYRKSLGNFEVSTGLSFGDRAPSVSEGFGFYLFNSFDNHDYIGNPEMQNEQSYEANGKLSWKKGKANFTLSGNYFHMPNYIIGEVAQDLSTMTIGAAGVKIYTNLDHATQYNATLESNFEIASHLSCDAALSYHRGFDHEGRNLPFISPLAYSASLQYAQKSFTAAFQLSGAGDQVNFNPEFGEDKTAAYTVFSLNMGKNFTFGNRNLIYAKVGVENIFDTWYSTFTDWANIPRMGRNVYATLTYNIN